MDNQPETGVNKQWAQAETTKGSKKDIKKNDTVISQKIEDFKDLDNMTLNFSPHGESGLVMEIPADAKNTAKLFWGKEHVGTISIKDGKTFHFEGKMDDSAAAFLIVIKRFIDNWLQLKDK